MTALLPVSNAIHAEALSQGMADIRDALRSIYVALTGENPWEEQP